MATNVLKFCRAGIENWVAFVVGVSGVACGSNVGRMLTGSGLFLGWAMTLRSKFMGIG